jgi:DNA-binding GntR family transcriptional regulator
MNGVGGSVDSSLAVSVTVVVVALAGGLITILGVLWRGFVWMDRRMDERIGKWSDSKGFRSAVAEIVSQASAGWSDLYNRQLEDVRHTLKELRERDAERADSVKRAHQRIDGMMERGGGK